MYKICGQNIIRQIFRFDREKVGKISFNYVKIFVKISSVDNGSLSYA